MEAKIIRSDRIKGAIYGLLVGDALGVPYEGQNSASLPPSADLEFDPPTSFRRSHEGVPPGTWSDDGAQALVLLHSLLECKRFDIQHFASGLVNWHDSGFMAVDGVVFDVGIQTYKSILELKKGIKPDLAGGIDEWSNGNGSLMRCLPLALWRRGSVKELIELAFAQSAPTHSHLRSKLCCALYCLWARAILEDYHEPWNWAVETLTVNLLYEEQSKELEKKIHPLETPQTKRGSGYVVDSLHAAHWASSFPSYETAVKAVVELGEDTDTTACVTGGIVGLIRGYNDIPARWIENLRGKELVEPLLSKLLNEG